MFLNSVVIKASDFPTQDRFPFNIEALRNTPRIDLEAPITYFAGRNGSGKSAMMDAIARKSGFLPWGGSKVHRVHENPYETQLANYIDLDMDERRPYGFHFRAEAFFNFAASLDDIIADDPGRDKYFGGGSLNVLSHGESFLAFFKGYSFQLDGLYLLDEPEAALSPENQLELAKLLIESAKTSKRQYLIATHSPILLACPGANILNFDEGSVQPVEYSRTRHFEFYRSFLNNPGMFLGN